MMFGLLDCNHFYASCERVFKPNLVGKPVIVLSYMADMLLHTPMK